MRRIFAQPRKELTQLVRDWRTFALALVLPLVLLVLMSTAISLTASHLPIVVQDLDASPASRDFINAFRASITFHVVVWPTDRQPEDAFTANVAHAALIIPEHFGRDITRGVDSPVQFLIDASDANTAKLIAGYAGQIARAYDRLNAGPSQAEPVQAAIRLWYNPGRSSKKFFGPGIFVLGLSLFPPLLASLAMAKEGEQKTILQVYVSNISAHEFPILYAFCVASFGTMVGAAIPNQAAAIQAVAFGGFILVFLLSGLMFPIENIPAGLRWISNFIWGRYYIEIVRDALLQGGGWPATWYKVAIIGVIGTVFYGLAWRKMRHMQLEV